MLGISPGRIKIDNLVTWIDHIPLWVRLCLWITTWSIIGQPDKIKDKFDKLCFYRNAFPDIYVCLFTLAFILILYYLFNSVWPLIGGYAGLWDLFWEVPTTFLNQFWDMQSSILLMLQLLILVLSSSLSIRNLGKHQEAVASFFSW